MSDKIEVVYVGPYDEVDVEWAGGYLTIQRDVPTAVPAVLAEGGWTDQYAVDDENGARLGSQIGGLLEQTDNWQRAAKAKPAPKEH